MPGSLPSRRLIAAAAACGVVAAILAILTPIVFGRPQPMVRLTWKPVAEVERQRLERQFRLSEPTYVLGTTWSYVPLDRSDAAMRAIVLHPAVADTDGIDRRAQRLARRPPLTPRRGGLWGTAPPWGARVAQLLAAVLAVLAAAGLVVALVRDRKMTPAAAWARARSAAAPAGRLSARAFRSPVLDVALFAAVVIFRLLTLDYFENDHFTYLTYAHQVMFGELPVRDFDDPGFPGMIALSALAMRLGGITLLPEALMTSAMLALAACVTYRAAWLLTGRQSVGLFAAALQVVAHPRLYSYPKIVVIAFAAWMFLRYHRRPSVASLVWLAVLTEVALILRHDLAVYVSVAAAALILFRDGFSRVATKRLLAYGGLAAALTIPYLVYLLTFGLGAHIASAVGFSRSEAARTTDWGSVFTSGSLLPVAVMALPLLVFVSLVVQRRREGRWSEDAAMVAATAVMLMLVNAALLRDDTPARLLDVFGAAPILVSWGATRMRFSVFACIGVLALVAVGRASNLPHHVVEARLLDGWRGVSGQAERQIEYLRVWPFNGVSQLGNREDLVRYLDVCTPPKEPILIVGFLPDLPFVARRRFAGGHAWLLPDYVVAESDQRRMAERLAKDPPSVVVIDPKDVKDPGAEWPSIGRLLTEYREPQGSGGLQIRTARRLPEAGIDPKTGLICLTSHSG